MRCEICQNREATIHLTEITDGVRSEMHLCENCAHEQGIAVKSHIPINELLSSLLSVQPSDDEVSGFSQQETPCPHCGFTLEQFREKALLGCPYDYDIFAKSLLPLIKKAHDGRTSHCGKVPSKVPKDSRKQIKLADLRRRLDQAVQNEDYERAAKLRDKIAETK